jgi:hypothetical protein
MSYRFYAIPLISIIFFSTTEAQWLEYKGSTLWNGAFDIVVQGNYAYTAGRNGMQIVDISEPNEPVIVSRLYLQGLSSGIDVRGDYAYVADRVRGLQIVDITDPRDPQIVGIYNNNNHIRDAAVHYPYCIIIEDSTMAALDISDPSNPVEVLEFGYGFIDGIRRLEIKGDSCLVLATWGFYIYEIADYGYPELKSYGGISWGCRSVDISGNYVYLTQYESVYIFDASTYQAQLIAEIETGCQYYDTRIIGNYAYFISETSGLHVYNIPNPANLIFLTALPIKGWWPRLTSSGRYLYYLSQGNDLAVMDVFDPVKPRILGKFAGYDDIYKVTASGNIAFAAEKNAGIHLVDVNSPEDILPVSFIPYPDSVQWFSASDDYLYVLNSDDGLSIYDISDPPSPFQTSFFEVSPGTRDMYPEFPFIYSCSYRGNLNIIDVSDPYAPVEELIYSAGDLVEWLSVSDNYVILISNSGSKEIVDISDPSNPVRIFDSNQNVSIRSLCADTARYIEVLRTNSFLRYDFNNRADPVSFVYRNDFEFPVNCWKCAINGYFAVFNDRYSWYPENYGVRLIDVGDPCCMWEIDFFNTPGVCLDIFIEGRYLLVADGYSLTMIDAHLPEYEDRIEDSTPVTDSKLNNSPNPFNTSTSIQFNLTEEMEVRIYIYDILGRKIETLFSGEKSAGSHRVTWNADNLPSGVYFYRLQAGDFNETASCLLLK